MGDKEDNRLLAINIRKEERKIISKQARRKKIRGLLIFSAIIVLLVIYAIVNSAYMGLGYRTVSQNNIHWHAYIVIKIKGVEQTMPANIGLDGHLEHPSNLHTHEEDGIIHMEMTGPVEARDLWLGNFFKVWDKPFDKHCILDYCDSNGQLHFRVNGLDNDDYENYVMQNGDEIEIVFE